MGSKSKSSSPKLPKPEQLAPLLELQAKNNRVGVETPYGKQTYRKNADGTYSMVTDVGEEGQAMIDRAGRLGMTDSAMLPGYSQADAIAGALAGRVGGRLGLNLGNSPMQLVHRPQSPTKPPKTTETIPTPDGVAPPPPSQPPPTQPPQTKPGGWRSRSSWLDEDDHYLRMR